MFHGQSPDRMGGHGLPAKSSGRREHHLPAAIMALASLIYLYFILRCSVAIEGERYFTLFDDAMISMPFAKNAAAGFGLLWN